MSITMCRRSGPVPFSSLLLLLLIFAAGSDADSAADEDNNRLLQNLQGTLRQLAPNNVLNNFDVSSDVYAEDDESPENSTCTRDIALLQEAIARPEMWALKMVDASSKLPAGILEGNMIDLGMYDECVAIRGNSSDIEIRGRHCMYYVNIAMPGNMPISVSPAMSICVPASCEAADIVDLVNRTIDTIGEWVPIEGTGISLKAVTCTEVDPEIWDTELIVCLSILVAYVAFLVICSLCEAVYWLKSDDGQKHKVLRTLGKFSLQKNAAALLSTKIRKGNLPVVHGVRFLSMAWVVIGHEYVLSFMGVNVNNVYIMEWIQSWKSLYIFIAPFAVDTFFTLSGFLMTYLFFKQMSKEKCFNVPMYYIHRYFRLTPSVIAISLIAVVFLPKMGSGARWDSQLDLFVSSCHTSWWRNLLYIQNFGEEHAMCLGHLWYLAVDMQLFLISPIILYPLYKKPKIGCVILAAFLLASMTSTATIVAVNEYSGASLTGARDMDTFLDEFSDVYIKPWTRAGPWLVGVYLGYEVANKKRKLSKLMVCVGWLLTLGAFCICTFGSRAFMEPDYKYDVVWETIFSTVSKPVWAFGVCWIIFASINNCGGPISTILSWRYFQPLSRLSYCVYLVHILIQLMEAASMRTPKFFSDLYVWHSYLSNLIISIVVAFFFSLLFESPIVALEKMIFKRKQESQIESQKELRPSSEEDGRNGKNE